MDQIDACIEAVANSLLNALIAGSSLLFAIYVVCRVFPRIPAAIRFGLWWIGSARILVSLACSFTIPLVIVVPRSISPQLAAPRRTVRSLLHQITPKTMAVAPLSPKHDLNDGSVQRNSAADHATGADNGNPKSSALLDARAAAIDLLMLSWTIAVAVQFTVMLRTSANLRRLLRSSARVNAPADLAQISQRIGLRQTIAWRTSPEVASPLVTGFARPTLVFPADYAEHFSPNELRVAIAHEVAHVRRADVLLSVVPTLAKCLFFFHPLVQLAYRECINCREEACDAIAVAATVADPASYAALLLKTALIRRAPTSIHSFAAPGMAAAHYTQLKRRLEAVRAGVKPCPSPIAATALATAALAFGVPYRVVLAATTALHLTAKPVALPSTT